MMKSQHAIAPAGGISPSPASSSPGGASAPQAPAVWAETTYQLIHPIADADGALITSVTLREPDVEALERIDDLGLVAGQKMRVAHIRGIVTALSGLPDAVVKKMHTTDFKEVGEMAVPLLDATTEGD